MLKTKLARKILTKKEQAHLTEMGINSLLKLEQQMVFMDNNDPDLKCWMCSHIITKLKAAEEARDEKLGLPKTE